MEIVNPQDAVRAEPFAEIMEKKDGEALTRVWLDGVRDKWLGQCGSCDGGLAMGCTCPAEDPRTVIFELWQLAQHQLEKVARLEKARGPVRSGMIHRASTERDLRKMEAGVGEQGFTVDDQQWWLFTDQGWTKTV